MIRSVCRGQNNNGSFKRPLHLCKKASLALLELKFYIHQEGLLCYSFYNKQKLGIVSTD